MENNDKIQFSEDLENRTRQFVLDIIKLIEQLPKRKEAWTIGDQLMRSSSSVGANYRAACRGRSKKEFYAKMCIVVEEADETEWWLDILIASEIMDSQFSRELHMESLEILKIMATIRKNINM
jgi:four helix bundle protein